ncbi:hypothetical protein M440DRAFT_1128311 [Trichoderma longibrachiatum ATCC 18648]|uniref:Uncharacterized protein n=1 Tax=Trichoderma longibrachiatum ATCC 18648 TaxID=983965 RepID=A0A2T4CG23_TRILO|nr:hypothetical protein M440DRAFT_1128311 [Trichoderma longibrachiatum ATCC 18648]
MDMVVSSSCWFLCLFACFFFLFSLCFWSLSKSREAPVRSSLWEMDVWSVQLHTATGGGPDARERFSLGETGGEKKAAGGDLPVEARRDTQRAPAMEGPPRTWSYVLYLPPDAPPDVPSGCKARA